MNMDTNEITINQIIGFEWNEAGTDVEDELPTPISSPTQIAVPAIPPAGTADPFGRGEGFDMELAKVMCEVSVLPSLVSLLQEVEVPPCADASDYAAPAVPELETVLAKKEYSQTRPMPCRFCGKVIRVDMYRHVARFHLDLVQLWRCPIAWCTMWKGSPQDCLEHVRSGHDAPWVSKTASIEKYAPPWTVRRQLWTDSLRIEHLKISTNILLFNEVGMPLTQHYRVYKGGLPHTDYLSRIRSLLPSPEGADTPPETGSVLTPKSVRCSHRVTQPKRLFPEAVGEGPLLTEQNPAEMAGETVIDCRPAMLPVSIPLSGLSPATISEARSCMHFNNEHGHK